MDRSQVLVTLIRAPGQVVFRLPFLVSFIIERRFCADESAETYQVSVILSLPSAVAGGTINVASAAAALAG